MTLLTYTMWLEICQFLTECETYVCLHVSDSDTRYVQFLQIRTHADKCNAVWMHVALSLVRRAPYEILTTHQ